MSLIRGDALTLPLADQSVDLIVTSPPYFALRSYTDACGTCGGRVAMQPTMTGGTESSTLKSKGPQHYRVEAAPADPDCPECDGSGRGHYAGQIGSEPTPAEFIDALIAVTAECVRVLKPSGSMWVNLGDKYVSGPPGNDRSLSPKVNPAHTRDAYMKNWRVPPGMKNKSLMGLPWRYALRCIDDLGLILRAEVIWSKPNGLPESVQDRVRRSHEQWFHFTREPRYFSAVDEIREPHDPASVERYKHGFDRAKIAGDGLVKSDAFATVYGNPLGKLPGSVWQIPTEPLIVPDHLPQHFAAFPSEWPRRIILGWSPSGVCQECGEGRRPVVDKELDVDHIQRRTRGLMDLNNTATSGSHGVTEAGTVGSTVATITGYACACPTPDAPTRPSVVLDPFAGTGTTVAVANALGRHGVGVDLSADYLRLARWRCSDPGLRAKALQVDKPPKELPGQLGLLDLK